VPILKQVRIDRRRKDSCILLDYARDVTSQGGEDGILERIFELIGARSRWCVEFGAWDGRRASNTYHLIAVQGWSGVLIEGDEAKFRKLQRNYAETPRATCVHGVVRPEEGPDSLDDHLGRTKIPRAFDLVSIDVDGNDYHIWKQLVRYRPRVVVIEFNPCIPNDVIFVQDRDLAVNQGCSLLALVELGRKKGYELACVTDSNAVFVDAADFPALGIADNSIDAMAFPRCDAKYFDGYDGTLFHVGSHKLHWVADARFGAEDLQILSPEQRRYRHAIVNAVTGRPR
jgi:hypothetical protein